MSALIITAIRAAFTVSASAHRPAASRCSRNRQAELRVLAGHIQPAQVGEQERQRASHSTRILLREVGPPQE